MKFTYYFYFIVSVIEQPGGVAQERINLSGTWQFAFAANQKEADRLERFYTSDLLKANLS